MEKLLFIYNLKFNVEKLRKCLKILLIYHKNELNQKQLKPENGSTVKSNHSIQLDNLCLKFILPKAQEKSGADAE